jgi:hypothetical protein
LNSDVITVRSQRAYIVYILVFLRPGSIAVELETLREAVMWCAAELPVMELQFVERCDWPL